MNCEATDVSVPADDLTLLQKLTYGLGHYGISVLGYMVVACVVPFYNPPPAEVARGAHPLVSSATLIALVLLLGRAVDFIADPLMGFISDRTHTRWGRRKPYLFLSTPLLVVAFIFLWRPPVAGSSDTNAWYALVLLMVFFALYAAYAAPYLGLLAEIARTTHQRVSVATWQGLFNLLGVASGALMVSWLAPHFGLQKTAFLVGLMCLPSLWLVCLGPRETEAVPAQAAHRELGLRQSLMRTLANLPFLVYWATYYLFWVGLLLILAGAEYQGSAFCGLEAGGGGAITWTALLGGAICLPVARWLGDKWGPRKTLLAGLLWFAATAPLLALVGRMAGPEANYRLAQALAALLSPAVGCLFALPYPILAEICDRDFQRTGQHREAMYFGFQGLMMKGGLGMAPFAAALIMQVYKASEANPLGYHLFGPVAGALGLLGYLVFWLYPRDGQTPGAENS